MREASSQRPELTLRPEPARRVPVRSAMGYVERIGVPPGESVRFRVSAPAAYQLEVVRLGRGAILDPAADEAADRAEAETVGRFERHTAAVQHVEPGSYIYIGGEPLPAGPISCGLWVRLWRLPVLDELQWAWSGLITDLDYPWAARLALLIDHLGRVGTYLGDGAPFDHTRMRYTRPLLGHRLGRWTHIAATLGSAGQEVFVDAVPSLLQDTEETASAVGLARPGPRSRLRIGASAEHGRADDFLDGDIAAPFVAASVLDETRIRQLVADRGRTSLTSMRLGPLHAAWDLAEEQGPNVADASGNGRHGAIVQGGTWQVGGPAFDAARGVAGYDPTSDPDRGHGLRLSSDDLLDCEWPVSEDWTVPQDAASGLYAGLLRLAGQRAEDAIAITFAVTRPQPRQRDSLALLLATNTWYAYGRRPADVAPLCGLSASFYSTHASGRPHFWLTTRAPIPRATPFGFESDRAGHVGHSHLVRPERYAEAWLDHEGYAYEVVTDHDLHTQAGLLEHFRVLFVAGHAEYWTDTARDAVEAFLDAGGDVISMSGDSIHWRLTYDPSLAILECRKEVDDSDRRWLNPGEWGERWHGHDGGPGGSNRLVGRHAHETLGLDPQGMIDDGTPTGFRPLRVVSPDHPLFREPQRVPISEAGTIGEHSLNGPKVSGYEFDALREVVGAVTEPFPGVTLLATAEQPNLEWQGLSARRGADLIYWERPGGGRVLSLGSIGATGSLGVDAGVSTLVHNALARFDVAHREPAAG